MLNDTVTSRPIDGHSIATLVVFLLVNVLVIFPLSIPIPRRLSSSINRSLAALRITDIDTSTSDDSPAPKERSYLVLGTTFSPVLGVLVLLASQSIDAATARKGVVGSEDGVKPYDIMLLFISLAYISISLDVTGLLRYLAFIVSQKGGTSGRRLFSSFYAFFFVSGMIVGNDPVILSGTGFLVYFTRVTGVSHTSFVFGQFAACNIASAVLVTSNPTNLILSSSFGITFTTYTAWVILPSIAASLAAFLVLLLVEFRREEEIPRVLESVDVEPGRALIDRKGAWFGSVVLMATLVVLVAGSAAGILKGVWEVTVPAALLVLARDLVHDWRSSRPTPDRIQPATLEGVELNQLPSEQPSSPSPPYPSDRPNLLQRPASHDPYPSRQPPISSSPSTDPASHPSRRISFPNLRSRASARFPTVSSVVRHLPFPLLPFAFAMFILVDGLSASGWSLVFARWWSAWASRTGTTGCVFGMGFLSVLLCNVVGTNIGCCLLLSSVIRAWQTIASPSSRQMTGSIYALALGSNFGAVSFTLSASLAGLLWRRILWQKGIRVGAKEFAFRNWRALLMSTLVGSAVLLGEVMVMIKS